MSKSDKKKSSIEEQADVVAAEPALAGGAHEAFHCEPDNVPAGKVLMALTIAVVIIAGMVTFVGQLFTHMVESELQTKVYGYQPPELKELHAQEQQKLTRYQWLDDKHEGVRVPLDRARELTVKAYREPVAPTPAAPVETAAPADTAAPAGTAAPAAGSAAPAPAAGSAAPAAGTAAPEAPTK